MKAPSNFYSKNKQKLIMDTRPVALIFVHELLGISRTFIKSHVDNLISYQGHYIGSKRVKGLKIDDKHSHAVNDRWLIGKLELASFRLFGFAPLFSHSLRKLDPVLIHAHHGTSGPSALSLAQTLDVPLLITFHGRDVTMSDKEAMQSLRGRQLLKKERELMEKAKVFITVSSYIKNILISRGYPENKIVIHYNGIDTSFYRPNPEIVREPIVLFVGRFVEKKGCEYLILAMEQVQKRFPDVELVLIGDGPLRGQLEAQSAKKLRRVRFLGFQSPQIVRDWMNQATILAVPSITAANGDSEGMPTVLLEAQAMGLPVVSSYHSGIPEAVIEGETALLSRERDWETLSEHLLYLLENETVARYFSSAARKHACRVFSLNQQIRKLEKLYDDVIIK